MFSGWVVSAGCVLGEVGVAVECAAEVCFGGEGGGVVEGAGEVQRVQAIYDALVNSGQQMTAERFNNHLAIMLAIAIDQLVGA